MKKLLTLLIIIGFSANAQSLKQQLSFLKKAVVNQQKEIRLLKKQLHKSSQTSGVILGNSENLKFSGDLRLRYEERRRSHDSDRVRWRQRLRLYLDWKTKHKWDFKLGFATGDSSSTSTNDTFSNGDEPFDTGDFRLDYASASTKAWGGKLTLGQQKKSFLISKAFFDGDIRPVGITYNRKLKNKKFITAGYYLLNEESNADKDATLTVFQTGWKTDKKNFLAASIYAYNHLETVDAGGEGLDQGRDEYLIASVYASTTLKFAGKKFTAYGDFAWNIDADDSNSGTPREDSLLGNGTDAKKVALTIGIETKFSAISWAISYTKIGADALPGIITDSDFGSGIAQFKGTNIQGYAISAKKDLAKNAQLAIKVQNYERIHGGSSNTGTLTQIDLKYKF